MGKNDIVLIDNPTIVRIERKLEDHDERFDEITVRLDRIESRIDKLEVDMLDVKTVVHRIQDALLPRLEKLAAL